MKREKNYKTAKFVEALEHIDVKYIEEAGKKIKERPAGRTVAGMSRAKSLRQVLALVACVLLLSAVIPAVTYLVGHLPDILGSSTGDDTTEQTSPETPPEETSSPAPETSVNTDHETTAPLYDGTTAPPEPEHNGSYGLEYKMNEDGRSAMLFHRGICTDENVIVASVWNGVPVTRISEAALAEYVKYKTVTIPESVTAIDMRAFKNCTGLESVVLHDGISYIGADAFENCVALTEITLPKSLEWIQTGLFMNCINLQKVIIGNEVERIVFGAFYDCSALRELHYLGTKAEWNKIQKDLDWNTKSAITVVHCSDGDVEITPYTPDEAVYDGSQGLEYKVNDDGKTASLFGIGTCTDTEIVVASTYNGLPVTMIGESALSGYDRVKSVTIPDSVSVIDHYAFMNCTALESVTMPDKINYIGAEAFSGTAIKNIKLPSNLTMLSVGAFKNCPIEEVVIPYSVEVIGSAFWGCSELKSVTIGRNVAEIKALAFYGCKKLTDLYFDGTVETWNLINKNEDWNAESVISVVHCSNGDVKIEPHQPLEPESDGSRGLEYRIIGDHAEVTGIGTCTDTEIVIPSYYSGYPVTQINTWAFKDNTRITSVKISDTVAMIAGNAFSGCTSLNSIYISASVIDVTALSFDGCTNITSITVDPDNPYYEGTNCIIQKSNKWLLLGCRTTVIPADGSVEYIGGCSFNGISGLYSITVPEGVIDIDTSAFNNCPDLRELHLSSTLRSASGGESNIISGCNNIEVITIPKNSEYFYVDGNCLIERKTGTLILGCKTSVIPTDGSIKAIGYYAFHCNPSLKNIVLPEGITRISHSAFAGCINLQSVTFPKSLQEIDAWAFENCSSLEKINIPENVTLISYGAFRACTKLTEAALPRSLKELSWDSFGQCTALKEIRFTGTKKEWNSITKDNSWYYGSSINAIRCSDGDVYPNVSNGSRGLEYRIEGDHAVLVGIGTCTDKDIVTATTYNGLPVTEIDGLGLSGYKGITSVTVSEGVTRIEMCAFSSCPDLRAVYLPSTLQFLSAGEGIAFENCDNIDTIKVADSNPKYYSVGNCLIERGTGNLVLACSKSILPSDGSIKSIGQFAFGGSDSLEKIVIPEGVTVIHPYAFAGCASLKSVTFPDSLTTVRWNAFANCTSLESVKLGDNVTEIGSRVFSGCSSLVDVTLPRRVDSFGEEIFSGCAIESIVIPDGIKILHGGMFATCRKLKNVTLPDGIETIVGFAFAYCSSLEKITLPRSVTMIQGEAFADCSNLTEFNFKGTKAEWNAIEKHDGWSGGCPFTVVHCSDGDV